MRRLVEYLRRQAHLVTALVLASFWPGRGQHEVSLWLDSRTDAERRACIAAVMLTLLALAFISASFGPLGLGVYFVAVVILVR